MKGQTTLMVSVKNVKRSKNKRNPVRKTGELDLNKTFFSFSNKKRKKVLWI